MNAQGRAAIALYVAVWSAFLLAMHARTGFGLAEPLFVAAVLGVAFPLVAWATTRREGAPAAPVRRPIHEVLALLAWLAVIASCLVWLFPLVRAAVPQPAAQAIVIAATKLALFVAAPTLIIRAIGSYSTRDLFGRDSGGAARLRVILVMGAVLVAFQGVFGRGLSLLREAHASAGFAIIAAPFVFVWLALEVGLVEEFFFRALLQTRFASVLRSDAAAIVATSVAFGLTHAPGLYFRPELTQEAVGAAPSLLTAVGYSIVIVSLAGLFLGVVWARTRDLWLVVALHALTDLLPQMTPTLRTFGLL